MRRLAALLALVLAAGCTSEAPATQTAPTGLAAAVAALVDTSYRFRMTANEGSYTGGIDPVADTLDTTVQVTSDGTSLKIDTMGAGGEYFARLTGPPLPGFDGATWFRVDPRRSRRPGALGISATKDPTGVRALVAASTDVVPAGERRYTGKVDLTKVAAWGPVNIGQVMQLGAAARSVPFEAGVDERGRLVSMRVDIPAGGTIKANQVTAAYADFGSPVPIEKPTAAEPLPEHLYALLGL